MPPVHSAGELPVASFYNAQALTIAMADNLVAQQGGQGHTLGGSAHNQARQNLLRTWRALRTEILQYLGNALTQEQWAGVVHSLASDDAAMRGLSLSTAAGHHQLCNLTVVFLLRLVSLRLQKIAGSYEGDEYLLIQQLVGALHEENRTEHVETAVSSSQQWYTPLMQFFSSSSSSSTPSDLVCKQEM